MLACVILNYNDCKSVLDLFSQIKSFKCFDFIVIVDNKSSDDSYKILKTLQSKTTIVIQSDRNGGYGYGNNLGILYAEKLGASHVLVCNPDVKFSEDAVINTLKLLKNNEKCVAAAPRVNKGAPAYKLASPLMDLCYSNLLLNKIFHPRTYPQSFFECCDCVVVDAIPGSFTLFDVKKFKECGLYDENIFLYQEEVLIAQKFKRAGYIQILNLKDSFLHNHSVSVNKSIKSAIQLKKIIMNSQYYYLKEYCNASKFVLFLQKSVRFVCYFEIFIWMKIKKKMV